MKPINHRWISEELEMEITTDLDYEVPCIVKLSYQQDSEGCDIDIHSVRVAEDFSSNDELLYRKGDSVDMTPNIQKLIEEELFERIEADKADRFEHNSDGER